MVCVLLGSARGSPQQVRDLHRGRLEMLLNFQTVVVDLTGLPVAGAGSSIGTLNGAAGVP